MDFQFVGGSTDPITLTLSHDSTVEQAKQAFQAHFSIDRPITLLHEGRILNDHLPLSSLSFAGRSYLSVSISSDEKPDLATCFSRISEQSRIDYRSRLTSDPSNFNEIAAAVCNGDASLISQLSREKYRLAEFLGVPINGLYSVQPTEEELRGFESPAEPPEDASFRNWPLNVIESDGSGHIADDAEASGGPLERPHAVEDKKDDDESAIERIVKMGYDREVVMRRWFVRGGNEKLVMEDLEITYGGRT